MRVKSLFALATFGAFLMVHADNVDIGTYDAYKDEVKNFCESKDRPWNSSQVRDTKNPLLKYSSIIYPDITNPNSDAQFTGLLDTTKGSKEELNAILDLQSKYMPLASEIEKSSAIYKERMNSIYACAVLNTKLRIHTKLMDTFRPTGSNIVNRLKQSSDQITRRIDELQCRNIANDGGDGAELSLKKEIIGQTTYEYCNYRHYLYYVDYSVKHRLGDVLSTMKKKKALLNGATDEYDQFKTTDSVAKGLAEVATRADSEIARTRDVYSAAFDSYTDFERNYASHVIMILIEDRYALLRDFLRETMNPIGQVIYLASNATSTGK